jgi:cellulose biosynthesis protein BcsQ
MAAAAIAGRLPAARRLQQTTGREADHSLAFHQTAGPLLAVCGLVGGAGASTLAYLLARRAARHSTAPVLLAELHEQAALAALAGCGGPFALRDLARAVDQERQVGRPFAELPNGLRLVASTEPAIGEAAPAAALARVLADARAAHGLVVIDAGPIGGPDSAVLLRSATHVLYALPTTTLALRRAELLAAGGMLARRGGPLATLVAVATRPGRCNQLKQFRRLAERHVDRLLLVPHMPKLAAGDHDDDTRLEDTFAALATLLRGHH